MVDLSAKLRLVMLARPPHPPTVSMRTAAELLSITARELRRRVRLLDVFVIRVGREWRVPWSQIERAWEEMAEAQRVAARRVRAMRALGGSPAEFRAMLRGVGARSVHRVLEEIRELTEDAKAARAA